MPNTKSKNFIADLSQNVKPQNSVLIGGHCVTEDFLTRYTETVMQHNCPQKKDDVHWLDTGGQWTRLAAC